MRMVIGPADHRKPNWPKPHDRTSMGHSANDVEVLSHFPKKLRLMSNPTRKLQYRFQ